MLLFCLLAAMYFLTKETEDLRSETQKATTRTTSLNEENASLRTLLETSTKEKESLQSQLSRKTAQAENLREEIEELKAQVSAYNDVDSGFVRYLANLKKEDPTAYEQIFYVATETEDAKTDSIVVPKNQWQELTTIKQRYSEITAAEIIQTFTENQQEELTKAAEIIDSGDWDHLQELVYRYMALDPRERQEFVEAKTAGVEPINWPPIIFLRETEDYTFSRGSAELSGSFLEKLETVVLDHVKTIVDRYSVRIVEVVGHTDEEPVDTSRISNLDRKAILALQADSGFQNLTAADNAGLGLARAIAVTRVLQRLLANDPAYNDVIVLPYSGGQVINLDERISPGVSEVTDQNRRRIEIRLRRAAFGAEQHERAAPPL